MQKLLPILCSSMKEVVKYQISRNNSHIMLLPLLYCSIKIQVALIEDAKLNCLLTFLNLDFFVALFSVLQVIIHNSEIFINIFSSSWINLSEFRLGG